MMAFQLDPGALDLGLVMELWTLCSEGEPEFFCDQTSVLLLVKLYC